MHYLVSFSTTAHALAEQPKPERPQIGASSLFEDIQHEAEEKLAVTEHKPVNKEYKFSSTNFRTSPRKLNMLARQIRNLPVEEAIKQMEFSDKRSAKKILHNLAFATKNATEQKEMKDLVVSQAWVGKGRFITRPNYHGRGQFGLKQSKEAHISFILKEKEAVEKSKEDRRSIRGWKESNKTWTQLNETKPIYNPKPFYNW
ncbi:ribosomal protein L22/L17 [Pilobolus umbonatus]|nr:ribosomal protein L22/L17 [Pilobolus umbonatus]